MSNDGPRFQYDTHYTANRLARTIGHVKLVRNMVEHDADCSDVLIQLAAVRGQLDSICSKLLSQYAGQVAEEYRRTGNRELLDAFTEEVARAMKK